MKNERELRTTQTRVAEQIREQIETGVYQGQLPNWEQLAKACNTSRVTVHNVLKQLEAEGLVTARQGRGTFVVGAEQRVVRVNRAPVLFEPSPEVDLAKMSLLDIWKGIGISLSTQLQVRELASKVRASEENKRDLLEAKGRELIYQKLSSLVSAEPDNNILRAGIVGVFSREISVFRQLVITRGKSP